MVQPPEKIEEQVKEFEVFCRSKGLKATHQRLEIWRELTGREDHPSAEMIYHSLHSKLPTLALDTVYRTLGFLEESGWAVRVSAFDDQARFDAAVVPHQHMICTRCRKVSDLWPGQAPLAGPPEEAWGWGRVDRCEVIYRGVCRECLNKE